MVDDRRSQSYAERSARIAEERRQRGLPDITHGRASGTGNLSDSSKREIQRRNEEADRAREAAYIASIEGGQSAIEPSTGKPIIISNVMSFPEDNQSRISPEQLRQIQREGERQRMIREGPRSSPIVGPSPQPQLTSPIRQEPMTNASRIRNAYSAVTGFAEEERRKTRVALGGEQPRPGENVRAERAMLFAGLVLPEGKAVKIGGPLIKKGVVAIAKSGATRYSINLLKNAGIGLAEFEIAYFGAKQATQAITTTPQERALINTPQFANVAATQSREEAQAIKKQGFLQNIAYGVNPALSSEKETYYSGFESAGIPRSLAAKERKSRAVGEAFGLLDLSAATERFGLTEFTRVFGENAVKGVKIPLNKAAAKIGLTAATIVAPAGFIEGSVGQFGQTQARLQQQRSQDILLSGGLGSVSAGLLGAGIAGLKVNSPGKSIALETAASIIDPFEKPGDILASLQRGAARRLGKNIVEPQVVLSGVKVPTLSFSVGTEGKGKGKAPRGRGGVVSFVNPFTSPTPATVLTPSTQSRVGVPTNPFVINTPIDTNPFSFTPVNTPTTIPISDAGDTFNLAYSNDVFIDTSVTTSTPTISTTSNVGIPVVSPLFRVPAPLPISGEGGGYGTRTGKKNTYVGELELGQLLLRDLLGGVPGRDTRKIRIGKKRRSR